MNKKYYVRPGLYKHFKHGAVYEVISTGRHSETYESMVCYRAPNGEIWFRPYSSFMSPAELEDGTIVVRYQYLNSDW